MLVKQAVLPLSCHGYFEKYNECPNKNTFQEYVSIVPSCFIPPGDQDELLYGQITKDAAGRNSRSVKCVKCLQRQCIFSRRYIQKCEDMSDLGTRPLTVFTELKVKLTLLLAQ